MAFDGTDSCWIPDFPYERDDEWRLKIAQFGDGYAQRTLDGINALKRRWSLTFENREESVISAMTNYLYAQQAKAFLFSPVMGVPATTRVFCDRWQVTWNFRRKPGKGMTPIRYGTLSAEFVQAYGVTV